MAFATLNGDDLLRGFCDPKIGRRRRTSLGPRSPEAERAPENQFDG